MTPNVSQLDLFPTQEPTMPSDYALATCNFHAYRPEMGRAVSTSVGRPRFFGHPYVSLDAAAPHGLRHVEDIAAFGPRYLARLDEHRDEIVAALTALADEEGRPLVLLCYENLSKPGAWCHRSFLASWIFENTGETVVELGPH